jgi:hypothetical protein
MRGAIMRGMRKYLILCQGHKFTTDGKTYFDGNYILKLERYDRS